MTVTSIFPPWGLPSLWQWRCAKAAGGVARSFRRPAWALLGASVLSVAMGYATARQSLFWSDDLTLNYRAHEIAPHNVSATTSLAAAVAQHGMDGAAMTLYQQALAIQPEFWRANVNLAYLYYAQGNYPEAARFFARACAADPTDGDQFLYLGDVATSNGSASRGGEGCSAPHCLCVRRGKTTTWDWGWS